MDTIRNIKNILILSFCLMAIVLCVFTSQDVHAKTIDSNYSYLDSSRLDFYENMFLRSSYKSYLLASEVVTSGYSSYTTNYLCLSNDVINTSDLLNISLNCEELYSYYRNSSSEYVITKLSDNELVVNNSIYYASNTDTKGIPIKVYLISILLGIFCLFFLIILFRLFGV